MAGHLLDNRRCDLRGGGNGPRRSPAGQGISKAGGDPPGKIPKNRQRAIIRRRGRWPGAPQEGQEKKRCGLRSGKGNPRRRKTCRSDSPREQGGREGEWP